MIPVARSNGILTTLTVPEGGIISGQSAVLRMDGWTPEEMTVRSPAAMHLRWPEMTLDRDPRAPKSVEDQQKEIDKALKTIRDAFQIARSYWQARKTVERGFQKRPALGIHDAGFRWQAAALRPCGHVRANRIRARLGERCATEDCPRGRQRRVAHGSAIERERHAGDHRAHDRAAVAAR